MVIFLPALAQAKTEERFVGVAREEGEIVYREKHTVIFDEAKKPLSAETLYEDPQGKPMARMKSDFSESLNMPSHFFEDYRRGSSYGIRRENGKIILFQTDKGEKEKTKIVEGEQDKLQVGCQGFNYYLRDRLEEVKMIKKLPVALMVPGNLTSYDFFLNYESEKDGVVDFDVEMDSWFLRIFAPKLKFRYDKKIQRIVWFEGPSNLIKPNGKLYKVKIDYSY